MNCSIIRIILTINISFVLTSLHCLYICHLQLFFYAWIKKKKVFSFFVFTTNIIYNCYICWVFLVVLLFTRRRKKDLRHFLYETFYFIFVLLLYLFCHHLGKSLMRYSLDNFVIVFLLLL